MCKNCQIQVDKRYLQKLKNFFVSASRSFPLHHHHFEITLESHKITFFAILQLSKIFWCQVVNGIFGICLTQERVMNFVNVAYMQKGLDLAQSFSGICLTQERVMNIHYELCERILHAVGTGFGSVVFIALKR